MCDRMADNGSEARESRAVCARHRVEWSGQSEAKKEADAKRVKRAEGGQRGRCRRNRSAASKVTGKAGASEG
jgi:hypothetical protein